MPYIYPKRFLRTRDILDPNAFQADMDEPKTLLDEGLDRHNIKSVAFKNLEGDAGQAIEDGDKPFVQKEAYYGLHHTRVECRTRMEYNADVFRNAETNAGRRTPNFVKPDGLTFRDGDIDVGPNQGKPYVVPHTGEWSVVQNADLSSPLQLKFTTLNKSNLWLCAYLQYVWQGFFEYKPPWIRKDYKGWKHQYAYTEGGATDRGWAAEFDPEGELCGEEAAVLNRFGPTLTWNAYPSPTDRGSSFYVTSHPYSFQLSEMNANVEAAFPNLGGYHHISRGAYACQVQFALRVDGEIIDETITGKQFSYEESAHGLKVQDGPFYELDSDLDTHDFRGQRSHARNTHYGNTIATSTAGQKIRRSRAVAMGPECLPVRLGAVVPLDPGNHTVEIVARRLARKKKDFQTGDFVGVFSRRLLAIELPLSANGTETLNYDEWQNIAPFKTEQPLDIGDRQQGIQSKQQQQVFSFNEIQSSTIRNNSMPNTHLPSKIVVARRKAITTTRASTTNPLTRSSQDMILEPPANFKSRARFPGFPISDTLLNRLTAKAGGDGISGFTGTWGDRADNTSGWDFVRSASDNLSISGSRLSVTANRNALLIMADIELLQLNGIESPKSTIARMDAEDSLKHIREYVSNIHFHKYLDLFAYFAIGYRTGDSVNDWKIASDFRPGLVNSFNWVNRDKNFCAEVGNNLAISKFISADETYGTGASEQSFTIHSGNGEVDRRGGNSRASGYGINIPLMAFIDETTTIKEVGVFTCTTFPTIWDVRHAKYGDDGESQTRLVRIPPSGPNEYTTETWKSPVNGRGILNGVEVMWGDCSLSVMKFNL